MDHREKRPATEEDPVTAARESTAHPIRHGRSRRVAGRALAPDRGTGIPQTLGRIPPCRPPCRCHCHCPSHCHCHCHCPSRCHCHCHCHCYSKLPHPPRPDPEGTIRPARTKAMTSVRHGLDLPLVHRPLLRRGGDQSDDGRQRLLADAPPMPVSRVPENPKSPPRSFRRRTARDQAEFQAVHRHRDRRQFRRRVHRRFRPIRPNRPHRVIRRPSRSTRRRHHCRHR